MTVKDIIRNYLLSRGHAGLFNADTGCGCLVGDLMPCDGECSDCEVGNRVDHCQDPECEGCVEQGYHLERVS